MHVVYILIAQDGDLYAYVGLLRRFITCIRVYAHARCGDMNCFSLQWKYSVVGSVAPSQYRGICVIQEIAIQVTRQILCNNIQNDNR